MTARTILAFLGAGMLGLGVFLPIVSLPLGASANYFGDGDRDGVFVLVAAGVILACTIFRWPVIAAVIATAALIFLIVRFVDLNSIIGEGQDRVARDLGGNPFKGIAQAISYSISPGYGWFVMGIGALLVIAVPFIRTASAAAAPADNLIPTLRSLRHAKEDERRRQAAREFGSFSQARVAPGKYMLKLTATDMRNADGTERQTIITQCTIGEALRLERDSIRSHDSNAVAVLRASTGEQIGYIDQGNAPWVARLLDNRKAYLASIESIGRISDSVGVNRLEVQMRIEAEGA